MRCESEHYLNIRVSVIMEPRRGLLSDYDVTWSSGSKGNEWLKGEAHEHSLFRNPVEIQDRDFTFSLLPSRFGD
jgi:hypothetical protein